jgi:adenylate kinase
MCSIVAVLWERHLETPIDLRILIFGPPGSGKGTYASKLSEELTIPHISTGELVREEIRNQTETGNKIESYSKSGKLVPDEVIGKLLESRISQADCTKGFILDGFPRTVTQAEVLERINRPDVVVNLDVPNDVIIERLSTRQTCGACGAIYNERFLKPKAAGICDKCGGHLSKRDDDRPSVINERLKVYGVQTRPLLDYYHKKGIVRNLVNKETSVPPDKVVGEILRILMAD